MRSQDLAGDQTTVDAPIAEATQLLDHVIELRLGGALDFRSSLQIFRMIQNLDSKVDVDRRTARRENSKQ